MEAWQTQVSRAEMKAGRFFAVFEYEAGITMTAIAHALSRAFQSSGEFDILKQIALFCAAGLLVSLVCLSYGLDLSPGFF